jgi:hypothetical protein
MATKKVTIPKSNLIPVDGGNTFLVRFRVVSDDRNRFSEWSQIFSVGAGNAQAIYLPEVGFFASGNIVNIVWQNLPLDIRLDVFLRSDGGSYAYQGTATGSSHQFINSASSNYQFSLQVASIAKKYSPSLQIFESEVIDVIQ